ASVVEHFAEATPAPTRLHGLAQAGERLVHALARSGLAEHPDATGSHVEHQIAPARQAQAADHEVGPPRTRGHRRTELAHETLPYLPLDDGHLTPAPLIGVADQPAPRHELCVSDRVHRAAVRALDPDGLQPPAHRAVPSMLRRRY